MIKTLQLSIIILLLMGTASKRVLAETKLTLWHSWIENEQLWQQIQQEFNASHKNITLKVKAFEHEEMKEAVIKSGFQKRAADILLMPSDWLGYNSVMQFSEIPHEIINPLVKDDIVQQSIFNDKIRGIPLFRGNHLLFMYNKSLVDKPAENWADLFEVNPQWQSKGIKTLAINYNEMFWFVPFISAFGGFPVEQDKITLNTQATIDALTYYKNLAEKKIVDNLCTYQCISTDFYQGKFAYAMAGSWAYKSAKLALGDNLGLSLFPKFNGNEFKPMKGNLILAFPKNSFQGLKRSSLLEFIAFIQQDKYQKLMFEKSGAFPVNHKLMEEILKKGDADFKISFQQYQLSNSMPASTSIPAVWNGMYKGFTLYMQNEITASEAVKYMQKSVEREQAILERKYH